METFSILTKGISFKKKETKNKIESQNRIKSLSTEIQSTKNDHMNSSIVSMSHGMNKATVSSKTTTVTVSTTTNSATKNTFIPTKRTATCMSNSNLTSQFFNTVTNDTTNHNTNDTTGNNTNDNTGNNTNDIANDNTGYNENDTTIASAKEIRKKFNIKVYGSDVPDPIADFNQLFNTLTNGNTTRVTVSDDSSKMTSKPTTGHRLHYLVENLKKLNYTDPTPIQMQSIPIVLAKRELLACAPTGSGKTLAFLLPMVYQLKAPSKSSGFRALIITPTRELAQQIHREFTKLSNGKPWKVCILSKATNLSNPSVVASLKSYDILISTPMRLVHALNQDFIKLNRVEHIILDEADKLLELGFLEQVDDIFAACTCSHIQSSLFSATISSGVEELAKTFMKDPVRIVIGQKNAATTIIDQKLVYVGQEQGKLLAIRQMIQQGSLKPPTLIFVESITRAKELFHELVYDGIHVDVIHAERTQAQRDLIISNFRTGKIWVLIATDLMSRGVDFKGIQLVINYDFPQSPASYIHRIGRTGRAGRPGTAITFFTKSDGVYLKSVVNVMKEAGCEVADWMMKLKPPTRAQKRDLKKSKVEKKSAGGVMGTLKSAGGVMGTLKREKISTVSTFDLEKVKKRKEMIVASKKRKLLK